MSDTSEGTRQRRTEDLRHSEECGHCGSPITALVGHDTYVEVTFLGMDEYHKEYYCNEECHRRGVSTSRVVDDGPFTNKIDTRAGDVALQATEEGLVVVARLTRKELSVAEYCGIMFPHPGDEQVVYFGPWENAEHLDEIDCCLVTKNTRGYLEEDGRIVYDTSSERYDYAFDLVEKATEVRTE